MKCQLQFQFDTFEQSEDDKLMVAKCSHVTCLTNIINSCVDGDQYLPCNIIQVISHMHSVFLNLLSY